MKENHLALLKLGKGKKSTVLLTYFFFTKKVHFHNMTNFKTSFKENIQLFILFPNIASGEKLYFGKLRQ